MKENSNVLGLFANLMIDDVLRRGLITQEIADRAKVLFIIKQRQFADDGIKGVA